MQDLGNEIFVQSEERSQDGFGSLSERASAAMKGVKDKDAYADSACDKWLDVRAFGQVFAFKSNEKNGVSVGVRGPVSIHQAVSVSPVEVESLQITKSVNGEPGAKKSSDTMGMKHFVRFGLYEIKGSINVQLAEKTGFTEEDAEILKECLRTLFVNDASSARPDGSMEVVKVYWFKHNCKDGQYSSAKVHRSLHVNLKEESAIPTSPEDYEITLDPLDGLDVEIIDGV
jgi:CRISPR-associated protein Csd2